MKLLLRTSLVLIPILLSVCAVYAQQSVGIGTNTPNPRAVLQLVSPGQNQGFLLPKLTTTQITTLGGTLTSTDIGLMVYDSLLQQVRYWNGSGWLTVSTATTAGTVTSVGLSLPGIFTVVGSPVTGSGTLSASFTNQVQNTVFAGPTTGFAAPTFRALVANDIPNLDAAKITSGTLPIARGGTNGTAAPTAGAVAYGTGTAYAFTSAGTSGQVLQSNGASPPNWINLPPVGWSLSGNTGTTAANFIGTTDLQDFRVRTNNLERMTFASDGNIGIGATVPRSRLQIGNRMGLISANLDDFTALTRNVYINNADNPFYVNNGPANLMFMDDNFIELAIHPSGVANAAVGGPTRNLVIGLNGIGFNNSTPSFPAHLITGATEYGFVHEGGGIRVGTYVNAAGGWLGTQTNHDLRLFTNNNAGNMMIQAASGNVGIGTNTPNTRLHVSGNAGVVRVEGVDHAYIEYFNDGPSTRTAWLGYGDALATAFTTTNLIGDINFATGAVPVDRMRITNTGNVGIGTGTPSERLHVIGNFRLSGAFMPNNLPGTSGQVLTSQGGGVAPVWTNPSSLGWGLSGNAGTIDGTNFIGTIDNIPFTIRTNNIRSARIEPALGGSTLLGFEAGLNNPANASSTAMGYGALRALSSGTQNTAIGYRAMNVANNAIQNVAVGMNALLANTDGSQNTAVGYGAMSSNTQGVWNVAVGMNALNANTTGDNNIAIGYQSLLSSVGSDGNVGIGNQALWNTTAGNNVAVGAGAGTVNITGTNNTYLGAAANASINNLTNATAIGANAVVGQSNTLVLGNNASVGIGTSTPVSRLMVEGTASRMQALVSNSTFGTWDEISNTSVGGQVFSLISTGSANSEGVGKLIFNRNTALGTTLGPLLTMVHATANVGIGSTSPARRLHIVDPSTFGMAIEGTNTTGTILDLLTLGNGATGVNNTATRGWQWIAYGNAFGTPALQNDMALFSYNGTGGSNVMHFDANGNVGLGTNNPLERLHVGANLFLQNNLNLAEDIDHTIKVANRTIPSNSGASLSIVGSNGASGGVGVNGGSITLQAGDAYNAGGAGVGGNMNIISGGNTLTTDNPGFITMSTRTGTVTTERMRILASGNVGIGTTAPTAQLHTTGGVRFAAFTGPGVLTVDALGNVSSASGSAVVGSGTINRLTYWNTSSTIAAGSNLGWDNANENLGVGWPSPERNLHLHRAAAADVLSKYTNTNTFVGAGNGFEVGILAAGDAIFRNMEPTSMQFHTSNIERMRISAAGNVGIGTTTPDASSLVDVVSTLANTIISTNNHTGASNKTGFITTVTGTGTGAKIGLQSIVSGTVGSAAQVLGFSNNITPQGTGTTFGINNTIANLGTGVRVGLQNIITSSGTNTSIIYGVNNSLVSGGPSGVIGDYSAISSDATTTGELYGSRYDITPNGSGLVMGSRTTLFAGTGTGQRYGYYSSIGTAAGNSSPIYGLHSFINPSGTGTVFSTYNVVQAAGSGIRYGTYNSVDATSTNTSPIYGLHSITNHLGTGTVYGSYIDANKAALQAGTVYGQYVISDNDGTGDSYLMFANSIGATTGIEYGLYVTGEDRNYFSNNVGIGTTTPETTLDIEIGNIALSANNRIGFTNSDGFTHDAKTLGSYSLGWYTDTWTGAGPTAWLSSFGGIKLFTGNTPRMAITSTGNIGIGTTTPNAPLQFSNALANRKVVLWEGANNDHQYFGFGINSNTLRYQVANTADDHVFFAGSSATTSNEIMRVKGNGYVGIGTASPSAILDIQGTASAPQTLFNMASANTWGTALNIGNSTSSTSYQLVTAGSAHPTLPSGSFALSSLSSGNLITVDGSSGDMAIGALSVTSNKIGIGVNPTGSSKVYVRNSDNSFSDGMWLQQSRSSAGTVWGLYNTTSNSSTGTLYGIYSIVSGGTAANRWSFYGNDKAFITAGTWGTSDQNLKENISEIKNAISIVQQIPSYMYSYKKDDLYKSFNFPEGIQYGFMAQDLEKVLPTYVNDSEHFVPEDLEKKRKGLISEPRSVRIKSVNYQGIIPILTQAIKEQQEQIELLKQQVEELLKKP